MNRIKNYIIYIFRIIKGLLACAAMLFKKPVAVIRGRRLLSKRVPAVSPEKSLEDYYPDTGRLSLEKGFTEPEPSCDLSVIIPMYNAEDYIAECIESVLNQKTGYSFEVILIDDGSPDNTLKVASAYLKDGRVRLIRQENSGQSSARNRAITQSRGRYLMFVDSDDFIFPGSIELLMDRAVKTDSDIAEGNVVKFYKEITEEMIENSEGENKVLSYSENPRFVLTSVGYSVAKVYKRELWESLRYPEGYIFEDVISKFILRRKANRIAYVKDVVYAYRQNAMSTTHDKNILKKLDALWVIPRVITLCGQEQAPFDECFYCLLLNHVGILDYLAAKPHEQGIKDACLNEARKQLLSVAEYRPQKLPLLFSMIEKAILSGNREAWEYIVQRIVDYKMLGRWREIN